MNYAPPVEETAFYIRTCTSALVSSGSAAGLDYPTVEAVLSEAGALARDILLPLDPTLDRQGASFNGRDVVTAPGHKEAYSTFREGGWLGLSAPEQFGGQALPQTITAACQEFWHAGSLAFAMGNLLTIGAIETLHQHASEDVAEAYLPRLVSGEWGATMALTEPDAGSDLSAVRTRAEPADAGTFLLKGNKIFISYGEHDLTENIVHLVLARLPDAPPGSRGLSLFLVPKILTAPDGAASANDVRCTGIEEKLGQHGSPTCSMAFGEEEGARAWLIGQPNRGLHAMFTMMNCARLAVAMQGVGIAERATQAAEAFASERRQGVDPETGRQVAISQHPDVERMLMTMRSTTTVARFLALSTADAIDRSRHAATAEEREKARREADILTPIAKSHCSQTGIEVADAAIQIHGGMGYVEETGIAQLWRDVRVTSIYEGTNGIQATDLVARKLSGEGLQVLTAMLEEHGRTVDELALQPGACRAVCPILESSLRTLRECAAEVARSLQKKPDEAFSVATPFLKLAALSIGAALLARAVVECDERALHRSLEQRLQFFAVFVLPETIGLAQLIKNVCRPQWAFQETA